MQISQPKVQLESKTKQENLREHAKVYRKAQTQVQSNKVKPKPKQKITCKLATNNESIRSQSGSKELFPLDFLKHRYRVMTRSVNI